MSKRPIFHVITPLQKRLFAPAELPPETALHLGHNAILAFLFRQARRFDLEFGSSWERTDLFDQTARDDNGGYFWSSAFLIGPPGHTIEVTCNSSQGEQMITALPLSETRSYRVQGLGPNVLSLLFARETLISDLQSAYLQLDVTTESNLAREIVAAFTTAFSRQQGWIDTPLTTPWEGFELCWNCHGEQLCPTCDGQGVRANGGLELPCEACDESAHPAWCHVCAGAGQWPLDAKRPYHTPGYLRTWPGNLPRPVPKREH